MKIKMYYLLLTILLHHSSAIVNPNSDCNKNLSYLGCNGDHNKFNKLEGHVNRKSRIIRGDVIGDPENAVRISLISDFKTAHCAGAIQNALYIITAAHCITSLEPSQLLVSAGLNSPFAQNRSVVSFESHPDWDAKTFLNDLALLKLNDSLVLTYEAVSPLELGKQNKMNGTVQKVWITGWGLTDGFGSDLWYSLDFRLLKVPLVDYETCNEIYHKLGKQVHKSELCAGGEKKKGPCTGDDGAPLSFSVLYAPEVEQYYTIGILSRYEGCADGVPGIYTDLEKYKDWIESKTG